MNQMESTSQAKSESKMKVEQSHHRLVTESESFSENRMETASCGESERLFSLKFFYSPE